MQLPKHQWKGVKAAVKVKTTVYNMKKIVNLFKCGTCEKPKITLEGLYYHNKHYHNNKPQFELYMPENSSCDNCKGAFRTLKLQEDHT